MVLVGIWFSSFGRFICDLGWGVTTLGGGAMIEALVPILCCVYSGAILESGSGSVFVIKVGAVMVGTCTGLYPSGWPSLSASSIID
jgi:hypothetical protein